MSKVGNYGLIIITLVVVLKCHWGISWSFNGFLFLGGSYKNFMDISISACSSIHLKFSHHVLALWSDVHFVIYSSLSGRLYCYSILYSDVNYILFKFRNISGLKSNISHVLLSNIEELNAISPIPCCKLLQSWWNKIYVCTIDNL